MAVNLAEHLSSRGHVARTVTTKLRYPDCRDPDALDVAGRRHRRREPHRRPRLLAPRSCAARPAGPATTGGRRRLRAGGVRPALASQRVVVSTVSAGWTATAISTEIRVRFAETDAQGIVHNANYAVWFEVARVGYLERYAGGYQRLRDAGVEALVLEDAHPLPAAGGVRRPPRPSTRAASTCRARAFATSMRSSATASCLRTAGRNTRRSTRARCAPIRASRPG